MRKIICRYNNGDDFLKNYAPSEDGDSIAPSLTFVADPGIPCQEVVRIAIVIDDPGERHDLHMRIVNRRPTLDDSEAGIKWRYRAEATASDSPWLEMLAEKFDTARRLSDDRGDRGSVGVA